MGVTDQAMVEVLHVVNRAYQIQERQNTATQTAFTGTTTATGATTTPTQSSGGGGPTSSPLLFFVALGFGVVFTNLWIIVGVKYCFRYNARNRQLRAGEDGEINLENMPTRPHRRRREKKLMTMDEVNERFPLTKYKSWVASRAREGLPTSGGVTAPPSRAGSVRNVDMTDVPASPVGTKHSDDRPVTGATDSEVVIPPMNNQRKSLDGNLSEKGTVNPTAEHNGLPNLKEIPTTTSTVDKQATVEDDEEEEDHIHTAVPPELLTNPGDSCAICIDTLEDDDDIRGLTCGHAFHAGCLDPWLTSRRACCPLCKADYYTPKPRPERTPAEEAAEHQRRSGRMNVPQQHHSAWPGMRGSPRLVLPGANTRPSRRSRRETSQLAPVDPATNAEATNGDAAASNRWLPRLSNPFNAISMPRMSGRFSQGGTAETGTTNPSPSQLEAGVRST